MVGHICHTTKQDVGLSGHEEERRSIRRKPLEFAYGRVRDFFRSLSNMRQACHKRRTKRGEGTEKARECASRGSDR